MSNDPIWSTTHAVKPVAVEEKTWLVPPQLALVQSAPLCRHGVTDSTMVWIKLTAPGGGLIHINVEQVTSVRSDTQVPGANAQLDLASGKLQGVVENVEQVMQLITAAAGARANECA
jgi:Tripartite tricarboxylate transporter family receptor